MDWLKNLFLYFLPPLHNANDFPSDSLTLGIFNNNTFFGTIKKIDKKSCVYLYIYVFTYANWNINLIICFRNHV